MNTRDLQIKQFIETNHMATSDILFAQPFFDGLTQSSKRDVMARLCKQKTYVSKPLGIGSRRYFAKEALGPDRLPIEYATLRFCHQHGIGRLAPTEIKRLFPEFPPQLVSWSHPLLLHIDGEVTKLVQVRVEKSRNPRYIINKHASGFRDARKRHTGLDRLIEERRFTLVIIHFDEILLHGAYDGDPTSLKAMLDGKPFYPRRVHLHHEPDLIHLDTSRTRKGVSGA